MSDENPPRECRCCRMPVPFGRLACQPHWKLLPQGLRLDIITAYNGHKMRQYVALVKQADAIWQKMGLWKAGVPS